MLSLEKDQEGVQQEPSLYSGPVLATSNTWIYCGKTDLARYESDHEAAVLSFSTASAATFKLVKAWIKECIDTHETCRHFSSMRPNTATRVRPEYVIEISPSPNQESDIRLRLVKTANLPSDIRWATLSHCWGRNPVFRTVNENLGAMLESIPINELPKTFRDAVQVTHSLGYCYLWIDSLCIIQDSEKHWVQESAIMGDVYHQSVFTIAASGAADGTVGCFQTRNPLCFQDLSFSIHPKEGVTWSICVARTYLKATELDSLPEEPLHTRGWVLQERLLSPRVIYYGARHVSFECSTDAFTESDCFPPVSTRKGIKSDFWGIIEKLSKDSATSTRLAQLDVLPRVIGEVDEGENIMRELWTLVQTYTSCLLTKGDDKLVAIGGIFRMIESITGLTNIAGLWKETFLYDLLWSRVYRSGVTTRPRPQGERAPTWSWASLNDEVAHDYSFNELSGHWKAALIDAGESGRKANGQIQGGWARLRAPVRDATLTGGRGFDGATGTLVGENGEEIYNFHPDVDEVDEDTVRKVCLVLIARFHPPSPREVKRYGPNEMWDDIYSEFDECSSETEHFEDGWNNEITPLHPTSVGLVVEPRGSKNLQEMGGGNGKIKWVRIGMFKIEQESTARFNDLFEDDGAGVREVYLV